MLRKAASAAAAAMVLAGGLALGASPALAASTGQAAGTPAGSSATLLISTIPKIAGVQVILDGRAYQTDSQGFVAIPTTSGGHHIHIIRPRSHPAGTTFRFSRWLDGIALSDRDIVLSPGTNVQQAGFAVSHPIAVQFADSQGQPVALSDVTRLTIDSSLGERFTFSPTRPPQALAANRIVRDPAGLVLLPIRYSVRDVIIDGANVVYGGSQNFFVHKSRTWKVEILLFPLQVKVQDALFGFSIGSAVRLTLPNGSSRMVALGPGHSVTLAGLPRATYQLVAEGPGFGLSSPSTLSKPQVARILLLSWLDIFAVLAFAALFLVGLPILGGRVVRRQGGIRLPVWHVGRSHERPRVAVPEIAAEEDAGDTPVPGPVTEEPAATQEPAAIEGTAGPPETAGPEDESASKEPAAITEDDNEAVTEVFAAITDFLPAADPEQSASPAAADHASSPGVPNGVRAHAISATSPARPPAAGEGNGGNGSVPAAAGSPANGRNGSVPAAAGSPANGGPATPRVKLTTWPTWKPGKL